MWTQIKRRFRGGTVAPTVAEIQRELVALRARQVRVRADQDAVGLEVLTDPRAQQRYGDLDLEVEALARQIRALEKSALPDAERREAQARAVAEAESRAAQLRDYEAADAAARVWWAALEARLVTGEELTEARRWRDELSHLAGELRRWNGSAAARRPFDPFAEIVSALELRLARISRSKWAPRHPITLFSVAGDASIAEAVERVTKLEASR